MLENKKPVHIEFTDYETSVRQALDALDAGPVLCEAGPVLLKPNLVNNSPFPVTTPPAMCAALVDALRDLGVTDMIIAEGAGSAGCETAEVFASLGYTRMARERGVSLLDLNHAPLRRLEDPSRLVHTEMYLPEVLFERFVISVPVLKAHSLAAITGAMKNMLGAAPPEYYGGRFGSWKKAVFHGHMHEGVLDLCAYRSPDLSVMDATVGLRDFHLGGPTLDPPANCLLAGWDARELDRAAAGLLGLDWRSIPHLAETA